MVVTHRKFEENMKLSGVHYSGKILKVSYILIYVVMDRNVQKVRSSWKSIKSVQTVSYKRKLLERHILK